MNATWAGLSFSRAIWRRNQSHRSTSGNLSPRSELRGHSIRILASKVIPCLHHPCPEDLIWRIVSTCLVHLDYHHLSHHTQHHFAHHISQEARNVHPYSTYDACLAD